MKIFILASFLGALSITAAAQTQADSESVTISGTRTGQAHQQRVMSAEEFGQFVGSYDLSNGSSLSLFTRGQTKFAVLQGQERHQIVATSSNSFVLVDKKLQMRIDLHDNGDVSGELLIAAGPGGLASGDTGKQFIMLARH